MILLGQIKRLIVQLGSAGESVPPFFGCQGSLGVAVESLKEIIQSCGVGIRAEKGPLCF